MVYVRPGGIEYIPGYSLALHPLLTVRDAHSMDCCIHRVTISCILTRYNPLHTFGRQNTQVQSRGCAGLLAQRCSSVSAEAAKGLYQNVPHVAL
jgi:hypothetical protein